MKLYLSYNIFGDNNLAVSIKHSRFSDMKKTSKKTKNTIEIRDRGWFSWQKMCDYKNAEKYFISRIQKQVNPLITKVYMGDKAFEKKRFQKLNLSGHKEVDFEIKPFKDTSGCIYRLKNNNVFKLRMKGKKLENGQWYWYIFELPKADTLSFADVHALYRVRWHIEEMFREIKQAFGGDSLRLRHEVSLFNHIYMMIIAYLLCKCFLKKIADANRKSSKGFMLDTCLKGALRLEFINIIMYMIDNPLISKIEIKNLSENFCNCAYSYSRVNSYRNTGLYKALKKMED